ncbi:MAG TPA: hypothetical protein VH877_11300 [Polyangia bacterium]|nr:hypothetical protein [Polyangia bacterium]
MRSSRLVRSLLLSGALAAAGCSGASPSRGLESVLRLDGQYQPGPLPAEDSAGPAVTAVESNNNTVRPGQQNKRLSGRLAAGARALALWLEGDPGYWILPAGAPDVLFPGELTYEARYALSSALTIGPHDLVLRAVDEAGRFGPTSRLGLTAELPAPTGPLVVTLRWDTESDLDIHVVIPSGVDIWSKNINSYQQTPGDPVDPEALAQGGVLDFDSNGACQIDGRRQEDVYWRRPPPSGHYVVRVDTFALCGEIGARWSVEAVLNGQVLGRAAGFSGETETRMPHVAGGGLLAFEFDVP